MQHCSLFLEINQDPSKHSAVELQCDAAGADEWISGWRPKKRNSLGHGIQDGVASGSGIAVSMSDLPALASELSGVISSLCDLCGLSVKISGLCDSVLKSARSRRPGSRGRAVRAPILSLGPLTFDGVLFYRLASEFKHVVATRYVGIWPGEFASVADSLLLSASV